MPPINRSLARGIQQSICNINTGTEYAVPQPISGRGESVLCGGHPEHGGAIFFLKSKGLLVSNKKLDFKIDPYF
jgi:hypothetical protein